MANKIIVFLKNFHACKNFLSHIWALTLGNWVACKKKNAYCDSTFPCSGEHHMIWGVKMTQQKQYNLNLFSHDVFYYWILPAFDAILGHNSAHSFDTGPVIAEPKKPKELIHDHTDNN